MNEDLLSVTNNSKAEHWNLEDGYNKKIEVNPETYPYRVFGAGARLGMFALLRLYEQHLEYLCRGPVQGFKITLHTPGEVPQVSKHYFRVPYLQEVLVAVRPNMVMENIYIFFWNYIINETILKIICIPLNTR